jgi:DNA-binding transcriptional LysR family regulator
MDHLHSLRVFVAVGETGGFASAARSLGLSAPAVTRAIAALEARIGARLVHRTTRVVRLTEAGGRLLVDTRQILDALDEAEREAAGDLLAVRGTLSVTASAMVGRRVVAPLVLRLLEAHPELSVRMLFVDRVVDLLEEGVDVAVRIAHLPDSGLTAVRVGSVRRMVVAAPAWIARHGRPEAPSALADADAIVLSQQAADPQLRGRPEWVFGADEAERVRVRPRIVVNAVEPAIDAAVAGVGVVRVLSYQVAAEVASGALVPVLEGWEPRPIPVSVLHREGRRPTARVRAFVDATVAFLRASALLRAG